MSANHILPLTRNNASATPRIRFSKCQVLCIFILQISVISIIFTSLFIMNNGSGYNTDNSDEVHPVLWVSSFQTFYMCCILPFCRKQDKIVKVSFVPYITLLILSTQIFLQHNGFAFKQRIAIYHFVNLVSNYLIILIGCNMLVYYRYHGQNTIASRQEYIINYNVVPSIKDMTRRETINEICSICIEHIVDERVNVKTNCGHTFHKECIDRWVSYNNDICPNCRKNIIV